MTTVSRRDFGKIGLTLMSTIPFLCLTQARARSFVNGTLHSFSDGIMNLPIEMLWDSAPASKLKKILSEETDKVDVVSRPVNVNLLDTGDRKILFDAGSGTNFLSSLGQLPAALEAANVDVGAVTDVVFTHAHPDHIWGIIDDFDDLLMPDATYHIGREEWNFWDSDNAISAMPEGRENFAVGAKTRFDMIRENVNLFDPGAEVLPNIEAVNTAGHTPGHMSFLIHDPKRPVLIAGDALTHSLISFRHPEWRTQSDMDPDLAARHRSVILKRLFDEKIELAGTHLPAPGFGYVEKHESAWRYVAID